MLHSARSAPQVVDEVLSLFATMKLEPTRRSDSPTNDAADALDATPAETGSRDSGDVDMSSDVHTVRLDSIGSTFHTFIISSNEVSVI